MNANPRRIPHDAFPRGGGPRDAALAVEIAAHAGDATQEAADRCVVLGDRWVALLTGLIRR
ncbi:MAG: hypothetical protein IPF92_06685 [Myxococcales bacterium]|nr:hypothetical protein [Myxococcales bacterium]HQY60081.1 hypothetical protein [Polyangiaceae bacterium]